jgi:hypothetical protein
MAGHALIVSDIKIATSKPSVSQAEPLARKPKIRSAIGPERAVLTGGGLVMVRAVV